MLWLTCISSSLGEADGWLKSQQHSLGSYVQRRPILYSPWFWYRQRPHLVMSKGRYGTVRGFDWAAFLAGIQRTYRDCFFPLRNCEIPFRWLATPFWRSHENVEGTSWDSHWHGWSLWEAVSCCPTKCGRSLHLKVSPGTSQLSKSGSKNGGRKAAERGGVWPCLLVHTSVTVVHFFFTQMRLLAFISPKANFECNYSFSLHTW